MTEQARAVRRFVERRPPRRPQRTGRYVVAAGKGGVGTSTTAVLLALAARRDGPVILVDAADTLSGLDRLLGFREGEAAPGIRTATMADGLNLVYDGERKSVGRPSARRADLRRAARLDHDPTVIVDGGARPQTALDALADFGGTLVTVVAPDGVSAPAAYALAKLAWRQRPETPLAAVAVRAAEEEAQLLHAALRSGAMRFAKRSVQWLGRLPDAPSLARAEWDWWRMIAEQEPALWHAAARSWRRLAEPEASRVNSTLTLWE